jgi:uncharacterized protein (DUF433 family)
MMETQRVVVNESEVVDNIKNYVSGLSKEPNLAARIKQHPAWYAIKDNNGKWNFGPSKFIGYANANAKQYLASYSRKDGKETEPALSKWFDQVDIHSPLGRELQNAFIAFAGHFGKTPNANWRVSVLKKAITEQPTKYQKPLNLSERIVFDSEICGGRPRIAGTRMRVSDLLSMLAEGADRKTILEDFPYLTDADISASLEYAAKSTNHLVMRAA